MSSKADPASTAATRAPELQPEMQLELDAGAVHIRENGIEFLSRTHIPAWTEVRVALHSPSIDQKVQAQGVVVSCVGDRHAGFVVTMVFLDLSAGARQRLCRLAVS